MLLAIKPDRFL